MKITVAIPTIAGREKYLAACLRTCVTQDNEDFEILVSDNSKNHGAGDIVSRLGDKRIRYVYPPGYLPMSGHWDFVLSQVSGDMLTIIGDDDGLMPGCINRVSELIREFPSKIIHHSFCNYLWPDYSNSNMRNNIVFFHDVGSRVTIVSADDILRGLCNGRLRYIDGPMIYHNFVPTRLLRQLVREGVFFRRASPDMYSAVALVANVESFVSTQECLTISGQGARATGESARTGGADGERFYAEMQQPLYKPHFNSKTIQMQLVDCIFEVAEEFAKSSMVAGIVYEKHLAIALLEIRLLPGWQTKRNEVLEVMRIARHEGVTAWLLPELCKYVFRYMRMRYNTIGGRNVLRKSARLKMNQSVTDIYEASVELDKIIHRKIF